MFRMSSLQVETRPRPFSKMQWYFHCSKRHDIFIAQNEAGVIEEALERFEAGECH